MVFVKSLASATAVMSLITRSFALYDAASPANLAMYWGQGPDQKSLGEFCASTSVDIIPLGFVNKFVAQANGWGGTNYGNACWGDYYAGTPGWKDANGKTVPGTDSLLWHCPSIARDIITCQNAGKKILISVGGEWTAANSNYQLTGAAEGKAFAEFLWGAYGTYKSPPAYKRPLDGGELQNNATTHIDIDGFDFDIEHAPTDGGLGYITCIARLRELMKLNNPTKKYLITGAPQCVYPDANMGKIIAASKFDALFIQFYNTASCAASSAGFNYKTWAAGLNAATSVNKDTKIYLGLLGSAGGSNVPGNWYLNDKQIKPLVDNNIADSHFGGIMLWDATWARNNPAYGPTVAGVRTFYDVIKQDVLNPHAPKPTSTSTTISSTTTKASSSSTKTSTTTTSSSTSKISTSSTLSTSTKPSTTSSATSSSSSSTKASTTTSSSSSSSQIVSSTISSTSSSSTSSTLTTATSVTSSSSVLTTSSSVLTTSSSSSSSSSSIASTIITTPSSSSSSSSAIPTTSSSTISSSSSDVATTSSSTLSSSSSVIPTTSSSIVSSSSSSSAIPTTSSSIVSSSSSSSDIPTTTSSVLSTSSLSSSVISTTVISSSSSLSSTSSSSIQSTTSGSTASSSVTSSAVPTTSSASSSSVDSTTSLSSSSTSSANPTTSTSLSSTDSISSTSVAVPTTSSKSTKTKCSSKSTSTGLTSSSISSEEITTTSIASSTSTKLTTSSSGTISSTSESGPISTSVSTSGPSTTEYTTSTIYSTSIATITSCAPTVTNCPAGPHVTTIIIPVSVTICPVTKTQTPAGPVPTAAAPSSKLDVTSTIYTTKISTITACPASVHNCPVGSVTTEIIPLTTTVYPATTDVPATTAVPATTGAPTTKPVDVPATKSVISILSVASSVRTPEAQTSIGKEQTTTRTSTKTWQVYTTIKAAPVSTATVVPTPVSPLGPGKAVNPPSESGTAFSTVPVISSKTTGITSGQTKTPVTTEFTGSASKTGASGLMAAVLLVVAFVI